MVSKPICPLSSSYYGLGTYDYQGDIFMEGFLYFHNMQVNNPIHRRVAFLSEFTMINYFIFLNTKTAAVRVINTAIVVTTTLKRPLCTLLGEGDSAELRTNKDRIKCSTPIKFSSIPTYLFSCLKNKCIHPWQDYYTPYRYQVN